MGDQKIILEVVERVEKKQGAALVTLTEIDGSSPGKKGNLMGVFEDGTTCGTVGGGNLEYTLIREALLCIEANESREVEFHLIESAALHMRCGGQVKAFIKIFEKRDNLIIVGGGHIGGELYKIGEYAGFDVTMIDDREEFCNFEKYPKAIANIVGDIGEMVGKISLDKHSYVVIVSRGHLGDKAALRSCIGKEAKYIGMIGSRKKIRETFDELIEEGISRGELEKIYSPIGLDISSGTPKEIGISIIAEILKVKNNLTGCSMKEKKGVWS